MFLKSLQDYLPSYYMKNATNVFLKKKKTTLDVTIIIMIKFVFICFNGGAEYRIFMINEFEIIYCY